MQEQHKLIFGIMRWSKRITFFSLLSWFLIMCSVVGLLYWLSLGGKTLDEYVASTLRTVLSSSSGVAITSIGFYMGHSALENFTNMQEKLKKLSFINSETFTNGNYSDDENVG